MNPALPGPRMSLFSRMSVACGVALVVFVAWTSLQLGGAKVTVAVEDLGEAVAAGLAAGACLYAARRSSDRTRLAWQLLAASSALWAVGELVWSFYEVGREVAVPFPSIADAGYLAAIPLAIAGVLAFPSGPNTTAGRGRALLDGAIVAAALLFVSWALGLGEIYHQALPGHLAKLISLAYPIGDVVVITLLALAVRKVAGSLRVPMALILGAFVANLIADGSFTYLTLRGTYGVLGSSFDTGWVIGYLLIGLAALQPPDGGQTAKEDGPVELWQLAMPWIGVLAVLATSVWLVIAGVRADPILTAIGSGVGVLFVTSQALTLRDSVKLIESSRRAERQLQQRTELLNEVIARAPMGIARVGPNLRVMDANPSLCALLFASSRILLGSSVAEYLAEDELTRLAEKFKPVRDGVEDTVEGDSQVRRADGPSVWLHWIVTAVRQSGGEIDYYLAMFEDISAEHEADRQAMVTLAGLERLNRLKSEFMSMVSHEFRTALTGIQGYSEVMSAEDVTSDEVKEFAGDINSDALRLNRMITEMLDLDRIESGRITLHLAPIDLNKIVSDAVERAQVASSKHAIESDLDPLLPAVDGDSDRLFQVIANLLSNAVKYSPGGGEIRVTTRSLDSNVELIVKDHGQGIPPEFTSRIFGRYERYEGNGNSKVVGTGLGLAIAQQIIQLHGGKIWVESKLGEGSEFHFSMPARQPERKAALYRMAGSEPRGQA